MAQSQPDDELYPPVLLIENLNVNKNTWKLARRLFRMLVSVGVIRRDIISIVVESSKGQARVYLRDQEAQEFAIRVFSDVRDVMNFFDVWKVTSNPMGLKLSKVRGDNRPGQGRHSLPAHMHSILTERRDPSPTSSRLKERSNKIHTIPEERSNDISIGTITEHGINAFRDPNAETPSSDTSSLTMHHDFLRLDEEDTMSAMSKQPSLMLDASTSVSGLPPEKPHSSSDKEESGSGSVAQTAMIDVKTSTPQVGPCFCPETIFYHKNQLVGTETRHAEFKQGGVVFELRSFRSLLGRYLCAFMNTEGGVIYFGVTDDGKAIGIEIDQKHEDQVRLAIDTAVSAIRPVVPTSAYSINFAKVMDTNGQIIPGLKVLEVCVHPRYSTKTPYSYDNNVYVRRDGSLRTL